MILTLQRLPGTPHATLGHLEADGAPFCDTLELPWRENQHGVSCIPAGAYAVLFRDSLHFHRVTLHIERVPERDGIEIHPANHVEELRGCIALGKCLAPEALMESKAAVEALEAKVRAAFARGESVTLEVRNAEVANA